ncbi:MULTISPECIES: hypothetical protein [unclassified Cyanobium]|uniref:hypothetical protein n=1 Tax=unclassified Cyanobium TaxID=2627006 RepID=UPI0020CE94A6|nr:MULTISPECIES: hypothetical protein [unclassified Cyanobium]MCP9865786.1 hypothetical protein [Cyanobium sp. Cruz-8D1]
MLVASALGFGATSANAAVVSLDFEDIAPYPNGNNVFIQEFYNGGTSSIGTSGPDLGISFGDNALLICLNEVGTSCSNTSRGGLGDPASQKGALFFLSGSETFLNYASGFDTGFSFNYVSFSFNGSVGVYDGLNGTGNLLASLNLTPNAGSCPGFDADFCPFSPSGVLFPGTAKSIGFGGVANQIVFDDITFGSDIPGPGPETDTVPGPLPLLGLGVAFGYSRKLRKRISGSHKLG